MAWGWLKGLGKVAGGLLGIGGGDGIDYDRLAGMLGQGLGTFSQGQAQNRDAEFSGRLDLERLLMDRDRDYTTQQVVREQEGRAGGQDAWRRLLSAQRVLNPAQRPNVTPYAAPQRQFTDAERQGAEAMTQEVMARLQGGNPIAPITQRPSTVDPGLLKPSGAERAMGWLAPFLTAAGAAGRRTQPVPVGR